MREMRGWTSALLTVLAVSAGCNSTQDMSGGGGQLIVDVALDGSGDYTSIQAAIDAAPGGATIQVHAGTYNEQLVLARTLTLVGTGSGTLVQVAGAPAPAPDDATDDSSAVLVVRDTTDATVRAMRFTGPQDGIQVRNAMRIVIDAVEVVDNGDDGIDVRDSDTVEITGTFAGNGDTGILVREGSSQVLVQSAAATGNVVNGMRVRESSQVEILACSASDNDDDGIEVRDSTTVGIEQSTIDDNGGYGIRVGGTSGFGQVNNTIGGNLLGDVHFE